MNNKLMEIYNENTQLKKLNEFEWWKKISEIMRNVYTPEMYKEIKMYYVTKNESYLREDSVHYILSTGMSTKKATELVYKIFA